MDLEDIILAPIITEKSMKDAGLGKFTFRIAKKADKKAIKKAVEDKFKVDVLSVSTINVVGKKRRYGTRRMETMGSSFKKAIVKVKENQKIDLFEVAGQS